VTSKPKEPKKSQADRLLELVLALEETGDVELFQSEDEPWVTITVDGHKEHWPLQSVGFHRWLSVLSLDNLGRGASQITLRDTIPTLAAEAYRSGVRHSVRNRIGTSEVDPHEHYIDLGDPEHRAIRIDNDGWSIVENPPVKFRRARGMRELPEPKVPIEEHPGDVGSFLNVAPDDLILVVAFILQALRFSREYPTLLLTGEQGSAKTTTARMLGLLIDPQIPPIQGRPRKHSDLITAAKNGHLLIFDNLSGLTHDLSDTLAGLATGTGLRKRKLHTDFDEVSFSGARPVILTGIGDFARRPDLLDRVIIVECPRIDPTNRLDSEDLERRFLAERPHILGRLLHMYQAGLQRLPHVQLATAPRMASFARWGTACLGDDFLRAYHENTYNRVTRVALESFSIYERLIEAVRAPSVFEDSPAALLDLLNNALGDDRPPPNWPKTPSALGTQMRQLAPDLRKARHEIDFLTTHKGRIIRFKPASKDP
jgi:hypothetical protein